MRRENETIKSFNELKTITQAIMLKKGVLTNATNQANAKAHTQERTQKTGSKPKTSVKAKKGALNPTKKAFSERQITAFRDNSQASANSRRGTKGSHNANAFKTEQGLNSNLRAMQSDESQKQGLATHQEKGGEQ
ncbi:hypothetical protein [Helicobacter pylori]|uniref:hypothetical protein n=1 Tax=Helicobacter pylori TaxID=210 RepID=UPI0013F48345|nr:hypothetical protein [Helicobacter pylori]NHA89292.1 hypothetical protein [Helicobacter pylori]